MSHDCCSQKPLQAKSDSKHPGGHQKFSLLIALFFGILVANLVAMTVFTTVVHSKLAEAVDLAKPQAGTLTTIEAENCPRCRSMEAQVNAVHSQNVDIVQERVLSASQGQGKELLDRYGISALPAVLFETEERIKAPIRRALEKGSSAHGDTVLVWQQEAPPYFDVEQKEAVGLVDVTFITDTSCGECFDPVQYGRQILGRFGVVTNGEETVDVSDASELLLQYNITAVPAVLLSAQASAYSSVQSSWRQIGSVEEDGVYVLRNMDVLRVPYKNLQTGEVVQPKTAQ